MSKRTPIKERIRRAYLAARKVDAARDYHEVLHATFPPDDYPRAWRHSSNGGPPGCATAFSRAVREMGGWTGWDPRTVWLPAAALRDADRQYRASRLLIAGAGHPHGWTDAERRYVEGED